jgi:hypothetical protein
MTWYVRSHGECVWIQCGEVSISRKLLLSSGHLALLCGCKHGHQLKMRVSKLPARAHREAPEDRSPLPAQPTWNSSCQHSCPGVVMPASENLAPHSGLRVVHASTAKPVDFASSNPRVPFQLRLSLTPFSISFQQNSWKRHDMYFDCAQTCTHPERKTLVKLASPSIACPLQFLMAEEKRRRHATEVHRRAEIERRLQPRTAADFDILYSELEAWRMQVGGQRSGGS